MASRLEKVGKTRRGDWARGETEYGGKAGSPQRSSEDGQHTHEDALTPGEQARILRTFGMRTESGEVKRDGTPWPEGVAREAEARQHVNGYGPEDVA